MESLTRHFRPERLREDEPEQETQKDRIESYQPREHLFRKPLIMISLF